MGSSTYLGVGIVALAVALLWCGNQQQQTYGSMSSLFNDTNRERGNIDEYDGAWAEDAAVGDRQAHAQKLTNQYYDLATDFYEYGWGQSFHFAPRHQDESFEASLVRHEHYLAHRLRLEKGQRVLDVGCGVGGPLRNIARFSGARVTGLNNNRYQIKRGQQANAREGLHKQCDFIHGDFMNMPVKDNTFDAAYAIEATCHAPDKVGVFREILRTIKPGGYFGVYEWAMTDAYNASDATHRAVKLGIEHGDGLPDLPHISHVAEAARLAGFEVLDEFDCALEAERANPNFNVPWYYPLEGHISLTGFKHTWAGRWMTSIMVGIMETIRLAPKGTFKTAMMLEDGAINLVKGGQDGIFTPLYFMLARKPL